MQALAHERSPSLDTILGWPVLEGQPILGCQIQAFQRNRELVRNRWYSGIERGWLEQENRALVEPTMEKLKPIALRKPISMCPLL